MTLPAIFDITVVREQHELLLAAFAGDAPIVIDASDVTRADAAALQLLSAAALEARRAQRAFAVSRPSASFMTVAQTLGLASCLGLGQV